MAKYVRNIQGHRVEFKLVEIDPNQLQLDPTNPRVGFSMRQLAEGERNDAACTLLLVSQRTPKASRGLSFCPAAFKSQYTFVLT